MLYQSLLLNMFNKNVFKLEMIVEIGWSCSGRENSYFGLARNLIRHLISPNQDDLSYSTRTFISGQQIG